MCTWSCSVIGAAAMLLVLGPASASGQAQPTAAAPAYTAPRTPDGQPDIQGVWQARGRIAGTSIECGYDANAGVGHHENFEPPTPGKEQPSLEVAIARYGGPNNPCGEKGGHDFGSTYYGMALPLQPWARAKKDEMFKIYTVGAKDVQQLDPVARCLPPGLNRTANGIRHVLQPPGKVVFLDESPARHRIISLDRSPHAGENIRLWNGDPRGRWEGQTLVVESTNFNGRTWLDQSATFHSDALRTVERFTILDANTIRYEITFDDPKVFTKPFTLSNTSVRAKKGDELLEAECLEGNRLENYGFK